MISPTVNRRRVFQLTNRICGNYNPAVGVRDRDSERALYVTIAKVWPCTGVRVRLRMGGVVKENIVYIYINVCRQQGKISLMNVWCKLEERDL